MTTPFITPLDEYQAQSKSPLAIGQRKLNTLEFTMAMTDEEMQAVCAKAKEIRDTYVKWEEFYRELDLRKKRNMGFKAAVLALDLQVAAAAMGTTPQRIAGVMGAYAAAEEARIKELEELWNKGILPDRDVLGDPSKDVIEDKPTPPLPPVLPPVEEELDPIEPPVEEPVDPPVEEPIDPPADEPEAPVVPEEPVDSEPTA